MLNGNQLSVLSADIGGIEAVAFSHDVRYIVSGSNSGTVCIWAREPAVGDQPQRLYGHYRPVESVAFSPDDTQVVSSTCLGDKTVRIWDVKTGQLVKKLTGHVYGIRSVMFSPCGLRIIAAEVDEAVCIWDASTGELVKYFSSNGSQGIRPIAISHDGQKIIAQGSKNSSLQVWDITDVERDSDLPEFAKFLTFVSNTGMEVSFFTREQLLYEVTGLTIDLVLSATFSHDGTRIACADGQSIHVWNLTEGKRSTKLEGHTDKVVCVAFSLDGKQVISSSLDNTIQTWDVTTGQQLKEFGSDAASLRRDRRHFDLQHLALSKDGTLACAAYGRSLPVDILILDTASGKVMTEHHVSEKVTCLSFSPDSARLIAGLDTGSLIIWDVRTEEQVGHFQCHEEPITFVTFFPDGFRLVAGSMDSSIRIWDMRNAEVKVLTGDKGEVVSVAVSVSGEEIVSGSRDGWIVVWDAQTGVRSKEIRLSADGCPNSLSFSPRVEHPQIVAGLTDNSVRVWDTTTGTVRVLRGHTSRVNSVAFSPDGTRIVSGSHDRSVRVWKNIEDPPSWHVDSEGWIWSHDDSLRLMWLSPELHPSLLTPHAAMIIWEMGYCAVSFEDCHVGTDWHRCYSP